MSIFFSKYFLDIDMNNIKYIIPSKNPHNTSLA